MAMLFRALQVVGWLFVISVSGVAIFVMLRSSATGEHPVVEYKDFVSILLTALGVMIALAAVLAAVAAFLGFENVKKDEIVPSLVENLLGVDRQVPGPEADQIAQEYAREGDHE